MAAGMNRSDIEERLNHRQERILRFVVELFVTA